MRLVKLRRWFIGAVIMSAVGSVFVKYLISRDPYKDDVEKYVTASPEVQAQIGNVRSLNMFGVTVVQASEREPGYRLYRLAVKGERYNAIVEVRADKAADQDKIDFSIYRLERKRP